MAVQFRHYTPDDRSWLVERHQTLYARDEGFDATFGPLVAKILQQFEACHDPACEVGLIAADAATRYGSIFCVRLDEETAKLRLFLVDPIARGQGLGQQLLERCMSFAKETGYRRMTLWTHASHEAACALYAANGWTCIQSEPVHSFGVALEEQTWTVEL